MKLSALPIALFNFLGFAFSFVIGAVCVVVFSVLMLLATPLWVVELIISRGALKSLQLASLKNCESYLDWMFSRVHPDTSKSHMTFVRLWGLEFQYR